MSEAPSSRLASTGAAGLACGSVLGLLALGPALRRGYVLSYDMVFVPHQPLTPTVLGTDGSVPRSVPNDFVVVLASHFLPGDVAQKVLLLAAFLLAGWGIGRLMPSRLSAVMATTAFVWSAYVVERLVIGHWGFLLGLAALPWVAGAAMDVRRCQPGAVPRLCLALALAGFAGSTALAMVAIMALLLLGLGPGLRRRLLPLALTALVLLGGAAPWLVPALRRAGSLTADPAGVSAFAARADTPLGVLLSVGTTGGIWNPAVWPAERGTIVVASTTVLLVLVAIAAGVGPVLQRWGAGGRALLATGATGLLLALAGALPGLRSLVRVVVLDLPGGGLVRDGQKFVALAALPIALCAGLAAERARGPMREGAWVLVMLPLAVLPSLAWGAHGRLHAVAYPPAWTQLQERVGAAVSDRPGTVAAFPFTYYRRYAWNGGRVVLDPMPRLLDADVLENDDLPLSDRVVAGEDPRAAAVREGLVRSEPIARVLRRVHVGYVVDQVDQPDIDGQRARLSELPVVWQRGALVLRRVPGSVAYVRPHDWPVGIAVGLLTLVATAGSVLLCRPVTRWYARRT